MDVEKQVVSMFALINGYLDDVKVEDIVRFEKELHDYVSRDKAGMEIFAEVIKTKALPEEDKIRKVIEKFKKSFV